MNPVDVAATIESFNEVSVGMFEEEEEYIAFPSFGLSDVELMIYEEVADEVELFIVEVVGVNSDAEILGDNRDATSTLSTHDPPLFSRFAAASSLRPLTLATQYAQMFDKSVQRSFWI